MTLNAQFIVRYAVISVLILQLIFALYNVFLLPAQGWDVLDWWAYAAHWLIESDDLTGGPFFYHDRHPATVPMFLSSLAKLATLVGVRPLWALCWLLLFIGIILIAVHYCKIQRLDASDCLPAVLALILIPISENHSMIAGYTEMLVAGVMVLGCSFIMAACDKGSIPLLIFGVYIAGLMIFIRNTGLAYFIIILFGVGFSYLSDSASKSRLFDFVIVRILWICAPALIFLAVAAVVANIFEAVELFGVQLILKPPHALDLFKNIIFAFATNLSFSVAFLSILFLIYGVITSIEITRSSWFICQVLILGFSVVTSIQFSEYGSRISAYDSDTGYSRFIMPVMVCSSLLAPRCSIFLRQRGERA